MFFVRGARTVKGIPKCFCWPSVFWTPGVPRPKNRTLSRNECLFSLGAPGLQNATWPTNHFGITSIYYYYCFLGGGRTGTRRFWAASRLQPGPGEPRPGPASAPCRSHTYILPVQRSGAAALCRPTVELTVGACTRPLRGEICPSWPLPLLDAASGGGLGATLPQQSTLIAKHGSLCGPYMDPHMDPIWIDVFG